MSARQAMRHRCNIERDQPVGADPWGSGEVPHWQLHLIAQPCHFWFASGRRSIDQSRATVIEDLRLLLPPGADVLDTDRVALITDRLGAVLVTGPLLIDTIGHRADHLVAYLKENT